MSTDIAAPKESNDPPVDDHYDEADSFAEVPGDDAPAKGDAEFADADDWDRPVEDDDAPAEGGEAEAKTDEEAPPVVEATKAWGSSWDSIQTDQKAALLWHASKLGIDEGWASRFTPNGLLSFMEKQFGSGPKMQPQGAPTAEETAKLKLDWEALEEELHPTLVKTLKDVESHYTTQLTSVQAKLQQQEQQYQQQVQEYQHRERQARVDRFEDMIAKLPPEYDRLLGKGKIEALAETSIQRANRLKLFDQMNALTPRNGMPPVGEDAVFKQALAAAFVGEQDKIIKDKLAQELRDRQRSTTARPTHRESRPRNPDDAAVAHMRKFFRERGIDD